MDNKRLFIENWNLPTVVQRKILTYLQKSDKNSVTNMSMRYYCYDEIKQLEKLGLIYISAVDDEYISKPNTMTIYFDGAVEDRINIKLTEKGIIVINILNSKKWVSFFIKSLVDRGVFLE
jgi:predicted RNA-binding protein